MQLKGNEMKIGKLDINKWSYNGNKLHNPLVIIWKLILYIPLFVSLVVFSGLIGLFNLDFEQAIETFKDNM